MGVVEGVFEMFAVEDIPGKKPAKLCYAHPALAFDSPSSIQQQTKKKMKLGIEA